MRIDLNADLGESAGPWSAGIDAALLEIVTSANVACGFPAGDAPTMPGRRVQLGSGQSSSLEGDHAKG